MADLAGSCKRVMKSGAHGYLSCSALLFGQWYKMLLMTREEEDSDTHGGKSIPTKDGEAKKAHLYRLEVFHCTTRERRKLIEQQCHLQGSSREILRRSSRILEEMVIIL